jgi:hypothetical protein
MGNAGSALIPEDLMLALPRNILLENLMVMHLRRMPIMPKQSGSTGVRIITLALCTRMPRRTERFLLDG